MRMTRGSTATACSYIKGLFGSVEMIPNDFAFLRRETDAVLRRGEKRTIFADHVYKYKRHEDSASFPGMRCQCSVENERRCRSSRPAKTRNEFRLFSGPVPNRPMRRLALGWSPHFPDHVVSSLAWPYVSSVVLFPRLPLHTHVRFS